MKREDYCGNTHRKYYNKSDKANAVENQNSDFQEGYAWGITFAQDRTGFAWEENTITVLCEQEYAS